MLSTGGRPLRLREQTLDKPPNLLADEFLSTPAIWLPGMDGAEWNAELDRTFDRAIVTHDFLDGKLTPGQFEDALHHFGIPNPWHVNAAWEEGKTFL